MDNKYKVSVIVPVYNVSDYIEKSIISICSQKLDSYEIIIVNDGTKDDSVTKAEEILKSRNFLNYSIITQENRGLPAARNAGLRNASGEYVVFVDSDDIITDDFLDVLYNCCVENNTYAAFTNYEITSLSNRQGNIIPNGGVEVLTRDQLLFKNMTREIKIHLCATLINREFILKNELWFNESLRYGEEVDYTWRMYPCLDKISFSKSSMYKYLVRSNSLMTSQNTDRVLLLFDNMHDIIGKWFSASPEDSKKFRWAESKIYFEKVHAFAKQSDYSTLKDLMLKSNYKNHAEQLKDFPDIKIRILSGMMKFWPYGFWLVFNFLDK